MIEQQVIEPPTEAPSVEWQLTVDALDALVLMIGAADRVIAANHAARSMASVCGIPDLIGTPALALRTMEPWRRAVDLARRVTVDAPIARAETTDNYSGRTWDVSVRHVPATAGDAHVAIMRDISNVLALEATARHNERVAELGRLVGNVAHEVRNPLFSMSATLDALEARLGSEAPIARYTENLRRELRRITALMQDLLEYGKPPVLEARIEKVSSPLLDAITSASPAAAARSVALRLERGDGEGRALLDRSRIAQAFHNILENAIHYSPPGSTVSVRLSETEVEGQVWIACSVEDEGPGFPDDVLPMVFEPFYTTRAGGTGLGLSIVRRIVEMHGGQAYAANRPEGGARVTICLPARAEEA